MYLTKPISALILLFPLLLVAGSAAADIGLSLIAVLFLAHCTFQCQWGWARSPWFMICLAIWIYLNLRNLGVDAPETALKRSLPWLRYPIFAAAVAFTLHLNKTLPRQLMAALMVVTGFLSLDGLWQYVVGQDIFGRDIVMEAGYPRLTGPYSDPMLGIYLIWLSIPVMAMAIAKRHAAAIIVSLLCAITLILSGERMAFLLLGFTVFLLAMIYRPKQLSFRRLALAGAIIISLCGLFFSQSQLAERQIQSVLHHSQHLADSPYGRIWSSATAIIKEHPVLGIGSNQFRALCPQPEYGELKPEYRCNQHPHQLYLEWLVDGGIIALGLFLTLLACFWRQGQMHWASLRYNPVFVGLCVTLIIRFWPLATSGSFFTSWVAAPLWFMIGWWLSYHNDEPHQERL